MRLDAWLKATRVVPRRTLAAESCRRGDITMEGKAVKASRQVRPGDRLRIRFPSREILIEIVGLPGKKSVSKAIARTLYTLLEEKRFDIWGREIT